LVIATDNEHSRDVATSLTATQGGAFGNAGGDPVEAEGDSNASVDDALTLVFSYPWPAFTRLRRQP
jgi:hypothetical protein